MSLLWSEIVGVIADYKHAASTELNPNIGYHCACEYAR